MIAISGPYGGFGAGSQVNKYKVLADNLTVNVGKIYSEYLSKTNEAIKQQDKIVFKKVQEKALLELTKLEQAKDQIPPAYQKLADMVQSRIDELREKINRLPPEIS